jgi:hypothetical protein
MIINKQKRFLNPLTKSDIKTVTSFIAQSLELNRENTRNVYFTIIITLCNVFITFRKPSVIGQKVDTWLPNWLIWFDLLCLMPLSTIFQLWSVLLRRGNRSHNVVSSQPHHHYLNKLLMNDKMAFTTRRVKIHSKLPSSSSPKLNKDTVK